MSHHSHTWRPYESDLPQRDKLWWCRCGDETQFQPDVQKGWDYGRRNIPSGEAKAIAKSMAEQGGYIYVAEDLVYDPKSGNRMRS